MSRWMNQAGVLTLMLLAVSPVLAQGPGGGRGGFGGGRGGFGQFGGRGIGSSPYGLLNLPAVQDGLGLSEDQKTQVSELLQSMREAMRGDNAGAGNRESFQDLSPEERQERIAQMIKERQERMEKTNAEFKPKFDAILNESQQQRLQQIAWQAQGVRALQDPKMAEKLGLTEEQKEKISAVLSEGQGPGRGGAGRGPGRGQGDGERPAFDREAFLQQMRERREKLDADVKAVLTDTQKATYESLLGPEFDVSQLRGGFGGRGGPNGERGPGGRRNRGDGQQSQGGGRNI